jgi:F-type H+-transporting ATPase subunit b
VLIDWFTVGAQALNFLILVWLLKRYLYRPVLAAIDAREKTIAKKIADAAARETQAQVAGEALHKRNEAFDQERAGLLRKATDEGVAERQHLIDVARQDSQLLRSKLTLALDAERAELGRQLSLRTQVEVFAVARQALADLAGASLEERMIEVFIARLAGAGVAAGRAGASGLAAPARIALVRSAFESPSAAQVRVEAAIRERLGPNIAVRFETSPELICGIELTVDGEKLAWSVAGYLSTLARDVAVLATAQLAAAPMEAAHVH